MSVPASYRDAYRSWRQTPMPPEDGTGARVALEQLRTRLGDIAARMGSGSPDEYTTPPISAFGELFDIRRAIERDVPESGRAAYHTYVAATTAWLDELARLGAKEDHTPSRRERVLLSLSSLFLVVIFLLPPTGILEAVCLPWPV